MTGIGLVLGALLVVMVFSEIALGRTKLQTGLSRVLAVWTVVYLAFVWFVFAYGQVHPIGFTIFWGGAFLSWFGVRSHVESSILLRMLYMLRRGALDEATLVSSYTQHAGEGARREELLRGGMAEKQGDRLVVTAKGRTILGVVEKLR